MKYDFYYSEQQKRVLVQQRLRVVKAVINDTIIEYTEMVDVGKKPGGTWEDYIFLGTGRVRC